MARPKTNTAIPAPARLAKSRTTLTAAGGQRLDINLSATGVADLTAVMTSHDLGTKKEAVELALRRLAAGTEIEDRSTK